MDINKNPSQEDLSIKLKLLDIFPSINELKQQKNEMDVIFQGLDIFHNLFELLSTQKEISLKSNYKSSIIISLIKSNNLFATSIFNIKQGEHWINFAYENKKKKDSNFAHTLIDCIKIKINCEILDNNSNTLNNNSIISNNNKLKRNIQSTSKLNYGSMMTESSNIKTLSLVNKNFHKLNLNGKLLTNKGNKRISLETSPKEKLLTKSKFSSLRNNNSIYNHNTSTSNNYNHMESIINKKKNFYYEKKTNNKGKKLRRMKTKNSYSKIIDEDLAIRLNKIFHKNNDSNLNLTQKRNKNNSNSNLDYSAKGDTLKHNSNLGTNKTFKNKQILKNKLLYNNKPELKNITSESNNNNNNNQKTEIEITTSNINNANISNNYENKNNNSNKRKIYNRAERSHDLIENLNVVEKMGTMTNRRNKDVIKDLKNNTSTNAKTPEISKNNKFNMKSNNDKTIDSVKNILNDEKNNKLKDNKDSFILKNFSLDLSSDNNDEKKKNLDELSDDSAYESGNYNQLKEDFILLYNDNYVKNVEEDLLKLEIELFVEKMIGLISAYHYELNEKKIQSKIFENNIKDNSNKYIKYCKLYYKLNLMKKNYKTKYVRFHKNKSNIKDINDKNFETNKTEMELFKLIFPYGDKKEELKKIINNILSKPNNKQIFTQTDLYKKWCDINKKESEKIINTDKNLNKSKDKPNKNVKPKTRTRVIPKLQQTKFNSKNNYNNNEQNSNLFSSNENISDRKTTSYKKGDTNNNYNYNYSTHNPSTEIYNKNIAIYSLYPNKYYSKKIAK